MKYIHCSVWERHCGLEVKIVAVISQPILIVARLVHGRAGLSLLRAPTDFIMFLQNRHGGGVIA